MKNLERITVQTDKVGVYDFRRFGVEAGAGNIEVFLHQFPVDIAEVREKIVEVVTAPDGPAWIDPRNLQTAECLYDALIALAAETAHLIQTKGKRYSGVAELVEKYVVGCPVEDGTRRVVITPSTKQLKEGIVYVLSNYLD